MAFLKVVFQLLVVARAAHLRLNEVDDECSLVLLQTQTQALGKRRHTAQFPDIGNIVSNVAGTVGNITDLVNGTVGKAISKVSNISDKVDAITDKINNAIAGASAGADDIVGSITDTVNGGVVDAISKVGNLSDKVEALTDRLNNAIAGASQASSSSDPVSDIIGAVADAAAAVRNVSSIFGEDEEEEHSDLYYNMTAARDAAAEAAKIAITVEKAGNHYKKAKASAQAAAQEALKDAMLIAGKTKATIEASEAAYQTVADKVNGRPTNITVVETTQAAEDAAKLAEHAAKNARSDAAVHKAKEAEAEEALSETLEAAFKLQDKLNETVKDSKIAAGLLKAKLGELVGTTEAPTTLAPTESGAMQRMVRISAVMSLPLAMIAMA